MKKTAKRETRDNIKTYAIILLASYIVGTKVIVHPLGTMAKLFMIALGIVTWLCTHTEKGEFRQLSYFAPFIIGYMLAA